jgi:hypothetical protein
MEELGLALRKFTQRCIATPQFFRIGARAGTSLTTKFLIGQIPYFYRFFSFLYEFFLLNSNSSLSFMKMKEKILH